MLPADSHVHSEWSWDTRTGSMEATCARAVEIGLPALAFTEHVDHTVWSVEPGEFDADGYLSSLCTPDGHLIPPRFDPAGYLAEIERCRSLFPGLRILSGLEVGEPHWHADAVAKLLEAGPFDRVIGSLHCLPNGDGGFTEPPALYSRRAATEVVRAYLAEIPSLVAGSEVFSVLTHIDYPLRYWPEQAGPFDLTVFEEEYRHALRVTAGSGRALEINTRLPMHADIVRWWREEGGQAVTFGSDAHEPSALARGFREAAEMARALGFRPGPNPYDFWGRA